MTKPRSDGDHAPGAKWFKDRCSRLVWTLRFLDSAMVAGACLDSMIAQWEQRDIVLLTSLYTAGVVHYGRMFTPSRSGHQLPSKSLRSVPGFNREMHDMLLSVRDKLSAHTDKEAARGSYSVVAHRVSVGAITIEVPGSLHFQAVGLVGPRDRVGAERIRDHLNAVAGHLQRLAIEEAKEIGAAAVADFSGLKTAFRELGIEAVEHAPTSMKLDESKIIHFPTVPLPTPQEPVSSVRPDIHIFRYLQLRIRPKGRVALTGTDPLEYAELNSRVKEEEVVQFFHATIAKP